MDNIELFDRASDFAIKMIMMFSTALVLLFFIDYYGRMDLFWILVILIISIICKGVTAYVKSRRR